MKHCVVIVHHVRNLIVRKQPFNPSWEPRKELIFDPKKIIMAAAEERYQPSEVRS
jgi:hypothetical protein